MRRIERNVSDDKLIDKIISCCHCCRLGLIDKDQVYIVPLNFGYVHNEYNRVFYFHSAKEGRKIDLINRNNYAAFELDCNYALVQKDKACQFTAHFQSIIGSGKIEIVNDMQEKIFGLEQIMLHNTSKAGWDFDSKAVDAVCIIRLVVEQLSCKQNCNA